MSGLNRRALFGASVLGAAAVAVVPKVTKASSGRISCEKGDPGERLYAEACGSHMHPKIYLDGVEQLDAVTADPGLGLVKRVVRARDGNIAFNNVTGEIFYEEVYGEVRIELIPEPIGGRFVHHTHAGAKALPA